MIRKYQIALIGVYHSGVILVAVLLMINLSVLCSLFSMFGDAREMELHYFLADDTVEICERIPNNSGRDAVPMFLRRQKLPKVSMATELL